MKFIDYYNVLGVDEKADGAEIKKAYRRLARKYHPDVSKEAGAEDKFKQLGEAYEVLKDPEKRAEYDQLRRYGAVGGEDFRPPPGWQPHGGGFHARGDMGGFSDFFEAIFGGRGGGFEFSSRGFEEGGFDPRHAAARDSHFKLEVTIEEAFNGGQRRVTLQDPAGGAPRTIDVRIPKGVTEGQKIRLRGQGGRSPRGGPAGDLYLEIHLAPHRLYRVEGRDLRLKLPVAPWEAVLGAEVRVPTPGGAVTLKVPADSRAGRRLRLKGRGLPGATPGDLIVELEISMPENIGPEGRRLLERMRDTVSFNPRAAMGV